MDPPSPTVRPGVPGRPSAPPKPVLPPKPGGAPGPAQPPIPRRPPPVAALPPSLVSDDAAAPPVSPMPSNDNTPPVNDGTDAGDENPTPSAPTSSIVELSWPADNIYAQPDSPDLIVFDADDDLTGLPRIKYATLEKLIERVTYAKYPDPTFLQSFMLTYRSFTTPKDLLERLRDRYNSPLPEGDPASVANFIKLQQTPIRLRVYNILKAWVTNHWHDFEDDKQFLQQFLQFVRGDLKQTMEHAAEALDQLIQRALEGTEGRKEFIFTKPPPRSILPYYRNPKSVKLLDLHPLEVARQLTLIEAELFRNIRPRECLNQAWNKDPDRAPNILAMIDRFNMVSAWVMTAIVQGESKEQQAKIMQHFVDIADKCRSLNNYNASMAILAGLNDSSIFRLKQHWAMLPPKYLELFQALQTLCSSEQNYKAFRAHLRSVELPCIPYLGMYLTDLTFIEDGNPNMHGKLVNFFKRQLVSEVISNIQQYQQTPYNLEPVKFLQFWLMNIKTLDKEKCYEMSLQILPRGNKVESLSSWNTPAAYRTATEAKKQADDLVKRQQEQASARRAREAETPIEAPIVEIGEFGEMEYIIGYRFGAPDSEKNIRVAAARAGVPQIIGGTVEKLVERLTHEKFPDTNLIAQFMATYRTFMSPRQLMELLIMRYTLPRPKNRAMLEKFKQTKEIPIQLRVFNVFKHWIDKYHWDFSENPPIQKLFIDFLKAKALGNSSVEKAATQLQATLRQLLDSGPALPQPTSRPPPKFPLNRGANPDSPALLDFHHDEVARQIALVEFEKFFQVRAYDLLSGLERSSDGRRAAVLNESKRANQLRYWMRDEFYAASEENRVRLFSLFTLISKACYDLRCFAAAHTIATALDTPEVTVITLDSPAIPAATKSKLEEMRTLKVGLESNSTFREVLAKGRANEPCVPLLGPYISEIVELEQEDDMIAGTSMINFEKRRKLAGPIRELEGFRNAPYCFESIPYLRQLISRDDLGERVLDMDTAREVLRQNLAQDPDLRGRVMEIVKQRLLDDLDLAIVQQQVEESMAYMRHQLGELSMRVTSVGIPELEGAMQQILEQQFPGAEQEQWSVFDETGHVYGWQQDISAHIVHKDGQTFLCSLRPNLDKAEIAILLRVKRLYEYHSNRTVDKVVVVTGFVSDVAQTIANHLNVVIFCCRPQ